MLEGLCSISRTCLVSCWPSISKFNSHPALFKLKVIDHARTHGKQEAGQTLGVDENCVHRWCGKENTLREMKATKCASSQREKLCS